MRACGKIYGDSRLPCRLMAWHDGPCEDRSRAESPILCRVCHVPSLESELVKGACAGCRVVADVTPQERVEKELGLSAERVRDLLAEGREVRKEIEARSTEKVRHVTLTAVERAVLLTALERFHGAPGGVAEGLRRKLR